MRHSILNHSYLALTTFRKIKKLVYLNPGCDYHRFVKTFQLKDSYFSNKDVVTNANKLWNEMKNDRTRYFLFHGCKQGYLLGVVKKTKL